MSRTARASCRSAAHPSQRFVEDVDGEIGICSADAQWRLDPEHIALEAPLPEQHTHLACRLEHRERLGARRRPRSPVAHQLDAQHKPHPADIADEPVTPFESAKSGHETLADGARILLET